LGVIILFLGVIEKPVWCDHYLCFPLMIGEKSAHHHNEDGKRATEGVNYATAKKAKTSTLST